MLDGMEPEKAFVTIVARRADAETFYNGIFFFR
jgi:hypothetical protein